MSPAAIFSALIRARPDIDSGTVVSRYTYRATAAGTGFASAITSTISWSRMATQAIWSPISGSTSRRARRSLRRLPPRSRLWLRRPTGPRPQHAKDTGQRQLGIHRRQAPTLGQKAAAGSLSVVLSSDGPFASHSAHPPTPAANPTPAPSAWLPWSSAASATGQRCLAASLARSRSTQTVGHRQRPPFPTSRLRRGRLLISAFGGPAAVRSWRCSRACMSVSAASCWPLARTSSGRGRHRPDHTGHNERVVAQGQYVLPLTTLTAGQYAAPILDPNGRPDVTHAAGFWPPPVAIPASVCRPRACRTGLASLRRSPARAAACRPSPGSLQLLRTRIRRSRNRRPPPLQGDGFIAGRHGALAPVLQQGDGACARHRYPFFAVPLPPGAFRHPHRGSWATISRPGSVRDHHRADRHRTRARSPRATS